MASSSKFLHYYLFKNGDASRNQKIPVKKCDIDVTFPKKGCKRLYSGYQLYDFDGEPATKMYCSGETYYGFVKVARGESFIGCDYQSAFDKLSKPKCRNPSAQSNCSQKSCCDKNKPSKDNRKPSTNVSFKRDSASSNQCSQNKCGQGSEEVYLNPAETDDAKRLSKQWSKTMDEMRRVSQCMVIEPPCEKTPKCPKKKKSCQDDHIHCVTEDNYPCCNDDSSPFTSDDEEEDAKPKKKGFLCCAKNAEPSSTNVPKMRRADSFCPPNVKKIQTTEEDFKAAQVFYKQALEVEKKRQKLYSRQKVQMSSRCANMRNEFDKLSPKEREKLNIEYKKAKKMYRQRRRMMEEKATKSLEKEIKMVKAVKN